MIITIAAAKGGAGKTTTAGALSMAAPGPVLCVDLDPQADLSIWLAADLSRPGAYNLIEDGQQDVIQATESGIDLICGHSDLMAVKTYHGSLNRLKRRLTALQGQYNYIFIDTPPGLGELMNEALTAADGVIIPLTADAFSLQAFYQVADIIDHINNPGLEKLGIILTQYDSRANVTRYMKDTIIQAAARRGFPFLGAVHKGAAITESQAMQLDLYQYKPGSRPAKDYKNIWDALTKQGESVEK